MRDQLIRAVETARKAATPPPLNEQETCFRIIDPLWKPMGYDPQDVRIQDRDNAGQKPDYTILPGSGEATWFLEAKAWSVTLQDNHAIQAVNYANTQGRRWVVLTNGREWRLYDNDSRGDIKVKLACVARLDEEDIVGLLEALSRPSIESRRLEDFVRNARLYNTLSSQILRTDSEVTRAVVKALRNMDGMSRVTADDVVGFWRDYGSTEVDRPAPVANTYPTEEPSPPPPAQADHPSEGTPLTSLSALQVTGKKLRGIVLASGGTIPVRKWYELTVQAACLALASGFEPKEPLSPGNPAKASLISRPEWLGNKPMYNPKRLPAPYSDWVIEANRGGHAHVAAAKKLLEAAGIDPATVRVLID